MSRPPILRTCPFLRAGRRAMSECVVAFPQPEVAPRRDIIGTFVDRLFRYADPESAVRLMALSHNPAKSAILNRAVWLSHGTDHLSAKAFEAATIAAAVNDTAGT